MFLRIIKNEWRNLLAEKSFLVLAGLFAALTAYGIYNAAGWIGERRAEQAALLAKQENELADKKEKTAQGFKGSQEPGNVIPNPSDPYVIGMSLYYAVLPFAPTAVLSIGQADVLESQAGVTVSTLQRTKADKTGFENPLSFLNGRFDLSFVIVYLLPLLILAVSFNLLSGEREAGVLQMLLSQPVKLKNVLLAKIAAQFVIVLGAVAAISLTGLLLTSGAAIWAENFWARLGLWILLVASYALFWFATAVFINSFGFSSATNAVAAAAVWLILVLILPSLLNVLASATYPMPPRSEVIAAIRGVNLDMRRDGRRLLAEHYQDHPELMPKDGEKAFGDFGLAFVHIQQEQKKRVREVEDRFDAQLDAQQNLVRKLGFLSPSVIAQEAANDLAGTSLTRYRHFREQVKEFDRQRSEYFLPRIYRKANLTPADFDQIPRFSYREEPLTAVAGRVGAGILFLLAAAAILFFLAFRKLHSVAI